MGSITVTFCSVAEGGSGGGGMGFVSLAMNVASRGSGGGCIGFRTIAVARASATANALQQPRA